jgi:hypothetical protein
MNRIVYKLPCINTVFIDFVFNFLEKSKYNNFTGLLKIKICVYYLKGQKINIKKNYNKLFYIFYLKNNKYYRYIYL